MWDIGCLAASIAFFVLAYAYILACQRLAPGATP